MRLVHFGPDAGHRIDRFGSDFVLSPVMDPGGTARVVCLHLGPGDRVGEHEAVVAQLFCVVQGEGWVSGADGIRHQIALYQAAQWASGEMHAAGTEVGLTAFVLEGDDFDVVSEPFGAAAG